MEETIKDIEVIAYKGMNSDMTCKGFHYELGKSYKTNKAELCKWGFHACLNPRDVLAYYLKEETSCYFKVLLSGEITKCDFDDTKVAATEITIIEEINIKELCNITEWWKNDNVIDLLYFSDGLARVQRGDGLWNFIGKDSKILSDEWFKWAFDFHDGFARVQREDDLMNFIKKDGKFLSKEWFDWADYFNNGFARVKRTNGEWNFIDKQGNYLSDKWFDWAEDFEDGFARVKRTNGECCKIDKTGKLYKD